MKLSQFIDENRAELEDVINRALNYAPRTASCNCPRSGTDHTHEQRRPLSAGDLREWILNGEGLYNLARSEGVKI